MMIAPDALASRMSLSVIAPTPRWMTSTCTSLVESCPSASASASAGPPWSALMTRRSDCTSPAAACDMKSSSDTAARDVRRLFASRSRRWRRCAISRELVASSTTQELIARHRNAVHAEHLHRDRRTRALHGLAALVEQGAHATRVHAADEVVADAERAVLHEHRRDRTLPRIELRLDDRAARAAVGIRLEVENLGLEQNLLEQLWHAGPLLRRDRRVERRSAELLEHDAVLEQLLLHLRHVRRGQVDLVDRDDHRHARVPGVRDRLDRLRHHLVIRGDDEDDDVGHLRPARAHGRECLVARRVEEGDGLAVRERDVVGADVLRDAAGLAGHDVGLADVIEQRRLAVVDVTHDGDDGGSGDEIFLHVGRLVRRVGDRVVRLAHGLEAELAGDQLDLVEVEALVDGDHQPEILEREGRRSGWAGP